MCRWVVKTCWRWAVKVASSLGVTLVSGNAGNTWSGLRLDRLSLCTMLSAGELESQLHKVDRIDLGLVSAVIPFGAFATGFVGFTLMRNAVYS